MSAAREAPGQQLIVLWVGQLVGTVVLAAVVLAYFRFGGAVFKVTDPSWSYYALIGIFVAIAPALLYLPGFKALLDADAEALRRNGGVPAALLRQQLIKRLALGGALAELPQALGVGHLLLGGETRWFLGATLITIALRLAYRPFDRLSR